MPANIQLGWLRAGLREMLLRFVLWRNQWIYWNKYIYIYVVCVRFYISAFKAEWYLRPHHLPRKKDLWIFIHSRCICRSNWNMLSGYNLATDYWLHICKTKDNHYLYRTPHSSSMDTCTTNGWDSILMPHKNIISIYSPEFLATLLDVAISSIAKKIS